MNEVAFGSHLRMGAIARRTNHKIRGLEFLVNNFPQTPLMHIPLGRGEVLEVESMPTDNDLINGAYVMKAP